MHDSSHRSLLVIPSINGGALLEQMLPTIRFPAASVVVLDQGSTDATAAICAEAGVELVQLGRPHTYTEACNIGAEIAKSRGIPYLCVANNDIVFRTDVMAEMAAALDEDPRLAIVAPAQIIIDPALDHQPLSYRVLWSLERVAFFHDLEDAGAASERLESDFCELTCVLIRMAAIEEVGFLDNEYGFYHEDADFGFRLRRAGWNCAYLPRTQIEHHSSSTFGKEKSTRKADYIAKNKLYFADKLLGHALSLAPSVRFPGDLTQTYGADLRRYLERYGLLDREAPELSIGYPDGPATPYLYTPFEGVRLPDSWRQHGAAARGILVTSEATRAAFAGLGVAAAVVPLGIEPDIFHPWRPIGVRGDETTYLAMVDGHQSRSLAVILKAWHRFKTGGRRARLRLLGVGLQECLGRAPDSSYRAGPLETLRFEPEGVEVQAVLAPLPASELAGIYRSVDYMIDASCGEGVMVNVLQAQASGVPCLFGRYGATAGMAFPDALTFAAAPSGHEPDLDDLVALLARSFALSLQDRAALGRRGVLDVRCRFTLRHSAMGMYNALGDTQARDPSRVIEALKLRPADKDAIATLTPPSATSLVRRVSGLTARRVQTVGRLTMQLGADWERGGFFHAGRSTTAELRLFLHHRSRQVSSLARRLVKPASRIRLPAPPPPGSTLLIGYVEGQLGLGQSSRDLANAMSAADVPFNIYPVNLGIEGRHLGPFMSERYDTIRPHAVNVAYLTPDELPTVLAHIGPKHFARSYNILRTYWELSEAPEAWVAKLEGIDELWLPNAFVADSFRSIFPRRITVVPPCVTIPAWESKGQAHFGLQDDRFYFLFSFDYHSFPSRKNPLAVIRAFRNAFPEPASPVGLIVKSSASTMHPEIREAIQAAARHDGRITVIDAHLSRPELLSLMKAADCYVSMHRSEGFGLGMAEAMAMGKPVIATGYSGNTEFVTEETGYPVSYALRKVGPRDYVHFASNQMWAEPSEASCMAAMVRVVSNPEEAAEKARAGRSFVESRYGPETVGRIVATRLNEIFAERGPG
ncbi:glycosyltransferase [Lichenihabitans sp. Uapishka_5]|uniref:glycosyltransferase n=1 Tax=Lichenihabitans sp. Uapishka_5 TaxID=3037302 RepID=UPI0029E7FF1C|nr:glycosyltransferase [Lichenihabitans sp. Uapishka_5]MDX7952826.1 glycosyltransferase [Lichenihabitans sp. Uapishka_5]